MGHLTLISEDVITVMEHSPPELRLIMEQYTPQPEWDEYVTGRYQETKTKDTSLLGGGKPAVSLASRPENGWKVDETDVGGTSAIMPAVKAITSRVEESRGEFRRSAAARREGSTDFGSAMVMGEEDASSTVSIGAHPVSPLISTILRIFDIIFRSDTIWPNRSIFQMISDHLRMTMIQMRKMLVDGLRLPRMGRARTHHIRAVWINHRQMAARFVDCHCGLSGD
jgi:hypothetical protein